MTLVQLQYFQMVCKYENFTKAAEALHISQPAMSAAMKDLEWECGVALFVRDKNSLKITAEGHILLAEANLVLRQYDRLDHVVKDLSLSRKFVRVGLSTLSGNQVYPKILKVFQEKYPDVQVISTEESTSKQFELLDDGLLDLTITIKKFKDSSEQEKFDSLYGHWPMIASCQYFCVGKQNHLAHKKFVTMEEISNEPLVMLKDNFNQTRKIKALFESQGLNIHVMHYTNQMYTVERFVEKNIASGFLPKEVADDNPNIVGIPYEGTEMNFIEVFYRKDRFQFKATKDFLEVIKELYPKKKK